MTRLLLALLLSACAGQVETTPTDNCGPVPDPSECQESTLLNYCGEPQLECGEWQGEWSGYTLYYTECDGVASLWAGDGRAVVCSEEWGL